MIGDPRLPFRPMSDHPAMDCDQLVELVTDYLDGVLDPAAVAAVDAHLSECDGCEAYLQQIRDTAVLVGRVTSEHLSESTRAGLLAAFRDLHRTSR
jgi:predicted anti-sigma-YlaC factor YlaD